MAKLSRAEWDGSLYFRKEFGKQPTWRNPNTGEKFSSLGEGKTVKKGGTLRPGDKILGYEKQGDHRYGVDTDKKTVTKKIGGRTVKVIEYIRRKPNSILTSKTKSHERRKPRR